MRMQRFLAVAAILLFGLGAGFGLARPVPGIAAPGLDGTAQRVFIPVDPAKAEDLVPHTEPRAGMFSLGWQSGEHVILDFPRMCSDLWRAMGAVQDAIPEDIISPPASGRELLPVLPVRYGAAKGPEACAVTNPKTWTVVDMTGRMRQVRFPYLALVYDTGIAWGWKLGSASLQCTGLPAGFLGRYEDFVFGLAYVPATPPVVRRPLDAAGSPTECGHGLDPLPAPRGMPPAPAQDKQARAVIEADVTPDQYHGQYFILCWHGISAVLRKGEPPVKVWLANVGLPNAGENPDVETALKNYFFAEENGTMRLLLIEGGNGLSSDMDYRGDFRAAVDLDGDGIDEVLVDADYYEKGNVRIYKQVGGLLHLKGTGLEWALGG